MQFRTAKSSYCKIYKYLAGRHCFGVPTIAEMNSILAVKVRMSPPLISVLTTQTSLTN